MSVGWGCEEVSGSQEKLRVRERRGDKAWGQEPEGGVLWKRGGCWRWHTAAAWRLGRGAMLKGQSPPPPHLGRAS